MKQKKSRLLTPRPKEPECHEVSECPIVAIGASAGGLEAFRQFVECIPADTGMAFVLVQHLNPAHDTLMPVLLAKHTRMKVLPVENGMEVRANHVYVITPNATLTISGCTFCVTPLAQGGERHLIDQFFRSVADDQRDKVMAIVLSGTGSDGTLGLSAIKEHGGLTMAQAPETAKFDSMPRSAIASGLVDIVLPVAEMPDRVVEYVRHMDALHRRKTTQELQKEVADSLGKIFPILRKRTGHDFSSYKQSTLVRRIQRRMQVLYIDSVTKYVRKLKSAPEEVDALFKDLLIGVTQFFRDPESFNVLASKVIPTLFQDKEKDAQIRIWVPGCSSGEEAYSLAMLLLEHASNLPSAPKIQVFATDLDIEALDFARKARYPHEIADTISPERLQRFFRPVANGYEVVEEVRSICLFSPHNVIKDPPFSRLDLISCRNLLIYLEADLQKRLLPLFHYALNPSGYLFLGPSENIASRSELFRGINPKHRIFQRKPSVLTAPPQWSGIDRSHVMRLQTIAAPSVNVARENNLARSIERIIIDEYAPSGVVINDQGEVLYFSGNTGKYLEPPSGVPNNKLIAMARHNLRLELRTAVHRAVSTCSEVIRKDVPLTKGRDAEFVDIVVRPLTELGKEPDLFIVLFNASIRRRKATKAVELRFADPDHPVIKQLENELRATREDLQTTIEELETSNEELKSANEELLSMNEELQSANEELQTSKEEIQSANDELQRKIEEVDAANAELIKAHAERAHLAAIVQYSEDAILGMTVDGTVTSWNNAAEKMFGFAASEMIGSSIYKIIPPELHEEEGHILDRVKRGQPTQHYETERLTKYGRRLNISLSTSPIRDANGIIIGVAKISRDITARRQAEELKSRLAAIVESSDDAIISKTLEGVITTWNKGAQRMYGYTADEVIGKPITLLMPPERVDEEPGIIERLRRGERIEHYETVRLRKNGTRFNVSLTVSPIRDASGKIIGASKIARDITETKRIQEELERRVDERTASLRETTEQLETFCYTIAHDLRSPLRAQQSFASVLLSDYGSQLDDTGRNYLQRIIASAERLDKLVADLLSYSRLSREQLTFTKVDLAKLVVEVSSQLNGELSSGNAKISIGQLHKVNAHAPTLHTVLTNLLTNALKFVAPDATPDVRIFSEQRDSVVRIWVEDNGIGISPENIEKIFGVFQRLHPKNVYPGTGIGLAIVQKAVERMGGRAGVESELDKGSRFWIDLPAAT